MTIQATSGAAQVQQPTTTPADPPPPPRLSAVEQGDVAAGRLRVAEGQVFAGTSDSAPATRDWGSQPAGSGYRAAFDSAAARLGTRDPATVGAELDRQLYGTTPSPQPGPAPTPPAASATAAPAGDQEGLGSLVEGAVMGDFGDNRTWSATIGQVGVGFIPIVGQIADARDTVASIGQVIRGEEGGWLNLGAAIVGWVPGIGDAAKAAIRVGGNAADAGVDVARGATRHGDEATDAGRAAELPRTDTPPPPPPAGGVPGEVVAAAAQRSGIPESRVREVLETPKPNRPDPSTYMSDAQIRAHLRPFEESGAIKFTPQRTLDHYGTLGPPDGGFAIPRSEFERLIEETGGDLAQVEQRLQLRPGELTGGDTVIAYIAPEDLRGLRVPSGNERGAWDGLWVPGGYTGQGVPEAVIDLPADVPYTRVTLGE
jgi:hypothetical protein